ncbi:hypothetical protein [Spirosoma oryzicola]|uniref:hypothetical protein n=1 Tax=Spirosoma oryzicola TaxID=2898794 RepID=UPI001E39C678|nr:hypothetical protein [Spirosoma oryzicola]UHG90136.1 hypothetical protein LQ777_18010 [Spirosoma oryzicola]
MRVSIETAVELFSKHLNKNDNKHILFSAPFGYGKSFFLENYFNYSNVYRPFWLSPVKYIVGNNEDIFEYIKLDIAIQILLSSDFKVASTPIFSDELYAWQLLESSPEEVAKLLLETIKDLDIPIVKQGVDVILKSLKLREEFLKKKSSLIDSNKSEYDKLLDFISSQNKVKGSIYEDDIITKIIRTSLQAIKYNNPDYASTNSIKENVLIIDDFDRLDPEHIFRILNIFSVHQNYFNNKVEYDQNKFGFDKIIIVCSINNIEKIYKHKYGEGVDFQGYIGKFYSTEIFHFDNQASIAYHCQHNFSSELDDEELKLLGLFLAFFTKNNKISIRNIVKHERLSPTNEFILNKYEFPQIINEADNTLKYKMSGNLRILSKAVWADNYQFPVKNNINSFYISSNDFKFFKIIQILTTIFGDYNYLKNISNEFRNEKLLFDDTLTLPIIKIVIPLMHFLMNFDDAKSIFANINDKRMSVEIYNSIETSKLIDLPLSDFLDKPITLPVGWNITNQYSGNVSYYSNVSNNFSSDINYTTYKFKLQEQLLNILDYTLKFLENKSFLHKLGISN